MNKYIDEILDLADQAYKEKEIPVGAIVVYEDNVIGRGYNKRVQTNDVTSHAEVNAIREAATHLNDWRLDKCDLYVTLKPCDMCMNIIKESRIQNVYYLVDRNSDKKIYNKTLVRDIIEGDNIDIIKSNYLDKLSDFFKTNGMR